jgi:NADH-quinone oxidoreductase subunit E
LFSEKWIADCIGATAINLGEEMAVRRLAPDQPAQFAFTPENQAWCERQIAKYPPGRQASAVLPLLWRAQVQHDNWLPKPAIELVARMLDMPDIRVLEVATFYSMFNLAPAGAHFIQLCGTTPCVLRGAHAIRAVLERRIGAPLEVTADGKFSWLEVECLGACCNAPMVQINTDYYEDLSPETMNQLMDDLAVGKAVKRGSQTGRVTSEFAPGKATTLSDPTLYDGSVVGAWRARFDDGALAAPTPAAPTPAPPKATPGSAAAPPSGQPQTTPAGGAAGLAATIAAVPTPLPNPPPQAKVSAIGAATSAAAASLPAPGSAAVPLGAAAPGSAARAAPAAAALPPAAANSADGASAKTSPPPAAVASAPVPAAVAPKTAAKVVNVIADDTGKVAAAPSAAATVEGSLAGVGEVADAARLSAGEMAAREEAEIKAKLANLSKNATAEEKAHAVGSRPVGLAEARSGRPDDLKRIKGIGKVNEGKLNALGIYHFDQIGAWTRPEILWVGTYLSFPGRIDREDWVAQAKVLAAGGETEFSHRVEQGEGPTSPDAQSRPKKG